jgi:hypothetical protein
MAAASGATGRMRSLSVSELQAAPHSFQTTTLSVLPFGSRPEEIAAGTCDDCLGRCVIGFAFVGLDASLYLYDYHAHNIKMVGFTSAGSAEMTILPAPSIPNPSDTPEDGAVGPDGALYLLSDNGGEQGRYALHILHPGDHTWTSTAHFDDATRGVKQLPSGGVVRVQNTGRLMVAEDSQVVLYGTDQRLDGGVTVAARDTLLPEALRTSRPPGIALHSGGYLRATPQGHAIESASGSTVELALPYASCLGADASGNSYYSVPHRGADRDHGFLECYDSAGQLVARREILSQPWHRELYGRGRWFVCSTGLVLQLLDDAKSLKVIGWTVAP